MSLVEDVNGALYEVIDPELGINIVDLGLVYNIDVNEVNDVHITMTLTTPGCPLHDSIVGGVEHMVGRVEGVGKIDVELVWQPAWTPEKMSREAKELLMF
ncbi:metal-sulfur cluster assembly factor [Aquibacillus sediminis]|uniref:metal-sulfur cluster assembly factor n=1 Tax=Aquibacillus sediminis TaxID=2574734 RepID=UPI0011092D5C|nr:iron-sulfur cluster assembly protein [Aquibacillus sediminis]